MKIEEAISELEDNLVRYTHEAETGTRLRTGVAIDARSIERRKKSIPEIKERLTILKGWIQTKHRGDLPFSEMEQLVIDMYDIEIHDITTPVLC